jgi:hypothetical protein
MTGRKDKDDDDKPGEDKAGAEATQDKEHGPNADPPAPPLHGERGDEPEYDPEPNADEDEEEYEYATTNEGLIARSPRLSDEAVEDSIALNNPAGSKDAYPGDKEETKEARQKKTEAAGRLLAGGSSRQPQAGSR